MLNTVTIIVFYTTQIQCDYQKLYTYHNMIVLHLYRSWNFHPFNLYLTVLTCLIYILGALADFDTEQSGSGDAAGAKVGFNRNCYKEPGIVINKIAV